MRAKQLSLELDGLLPPPIVKSYGPSACLSVGKFAKVLNSKGYDIGEKRLFQKLRDLKMIDRDNVPLQKYMDKGYFKIIRQEYREGNILRTYLKILITPIGQHYLEELLANEAACYRA